jgi:hypothetical protein
MSDKSLRSKLIRLAHAQPELRAEILPLLAQGKQAAMPKRAVRVNVIPSFDGFIAAYLLELGTAVGNALDDVRDVNGDNDYPAVWLDCGDTGLTLTIDVAAEAFYIHLNENENENDYDGKELGVQKLTLVEIGNKSLGRMTKIVIDAYNKFKPS